MNFPPARKFEFSKFRSSKKQIQFWANKYFGVDSFWESAILGVFQFRFWNANKLSG